MMNLGLKRSDTHYRKNSNGQGQFNILVKGPDGIGATEEESDDVTTPMRPIEGKVNAILD